MINVDSAQKAVLPTAPAPARQADAKGHFCSGDGGFSFRDLLDVVNPLQHIPVIGTLYRAVTGDTIGTVERIAGDTLYGGLFGAISAVADSAFEAVTGKDFGATILALFSGHKDHAQNLAATTQSQPSIIPVATAETALSGALQDRGVSDDLARRALFAYKKSMELPALAN